MFKLPKLETEVDCGPIGYPGLVVTFWLNVTYEPWEQPAEAAPWESLFYHGLARIIERVTFPTGMTNSGEAETWEIADGKALYGLMNTPGFDQTIIMWSQSQYQEQRAARLEAAVKN